MDDMDTLARLRADLPDPDPDVLAAARDRLTRRMAEVPPAFERSRTSWRALLGRRLAIGVATAAAVAVGAGVLVTVAGTDRPSGHRPGTRGGTSAAGTPYRAPTDASSALALAADHARTTGDPVVGKGQYLHISRNVWWGEYLDGVRFRHKFRTEVWVPADADGVWWWRETSLDTKFASAADERKVRASDPRVFTRSASLSSGHDGQPDRTPTGKPHVVGPQEPGWYYPTPRFLAQQPRDPRKLLAAIEAAVEPSSLNKGDRPTMAFQMIAEVFATGYAPADLRAALYRAARLIPGITFQRNAKDLDGRRGVSISKPAPYGFLRTEIVFDPKTGQFLGERTIVVRSIEDDAYLPVGSTYSETALSADVTGNPHLF